MIYVHFFFFLLYTLPVVAGERGEPRSSWSNPLPYNIHVRVRSTVAGLPGIRDLEVSEDLYSGRVEKKGKKKNTRVRVLSVYTRGDIIICCTVGIVRREVRRRTE